MTDAQLDRALGKKVKALFGLTPDALAALLDQVVPELLRRRQQGRLVRPFRRRAPGAGRKRLLSPTQEVLLTLLYLRHNVAHEVVGQLFGVSADTSENTFHEVVAVLQEACPHERWEAKKKWQKGQPSWRPASEEVLLVDTFETPTRRPSDPQKQRRLYSGKKKRHTLKSQVVTDGKGEILTASCGHRGPTAEQRIYRQSGVDEQFPQNPKQGDLGYQGLETVSVPHKKPPKGELTPEQKEENRKKAATRVRVEHAIRRIKGWRIMREDYRLEVGKFAGIAMLVIGLVQLQRLTG